MLQDKRVAVYMPNEPQAVVWIEATKRLGCPFLAIAGGTASNSLATRLGDMRSELMITTPGLMREGCAESNRLGEVR